jgi:outer membrane protein assembly factor BamD
MRQAIPPAVSTPASGTISAAVPARPGTVTRLLLVACLALAAVACGTDGRERQEQGAVEEVYERGQRSMANGNYRQAIAIFEQIQARFPFTEFGKQSQIDLIYAYYKSGRTEQAIDAADQFMRENPTHPRVDYALYLQGLTWFDAEPSLLDKTFGVDRTDRPPTDTRRSFAAFKRLVERYPTSDYAADATQRMIFLKNRLAAYENHVAEYYLRRGAWIAALNRAKTALEEYNGTPANKKSLEIMVRAYEKLDLDELAADTRRVLAENFPDS